jgi:hypothetical protein
LIQLLCAFLVTTTTTLPQARGGEAKKSSTFAGRTGLLALRGECETGASTMPLKFVAVLIAAVLFVAGAVGAVEAKSKHRAKPGVRAPRYVVVPQRDPYAVYYAGTYVGSDPDPRIRAGLLREFMQQMGNR